MVSQNGARSAISGISARRNPTVNRRCSPDSHPAHGHRHASRTLTSPRAAGHGRPSNTRGSMLPTTVALHDVDDVEGFVNRTINNARLSLKRDERDELVLEG